MKFYQMISRNNDVNGNPYRLIFVYKTKKRVFYRYNPKGNVVSQEPCLVSVYEARSSSPNVCNELHEQGIFPLRSVHVAPGEYNSMKRMGKNFTGVTFENVD